VFCRPRMSRVAIARGIAGRPLSGDLYVDRGRRRCPEGRPTESGRGKVSGGAGGVEGFAEEFSDLESEDPQLPAGLCRTEIERAVENRGTGPSDRDQRSGLTGRHWCCCRQSATSTTAGTGCAVDGPERVARSKTARGVVSSARRRRP